MAKTTSDSILVVIRKESQILDHFAWWRSALFECFSSSLVCATYASDCAYMTHVPDDKRACVISV